MVSSSEKPLVVLVKQLDTELLQFFRLPRSNILFTRIILFQDGFLWLLMKISVICVISIDPGLVYNYWYWMIFLPSVVLFDFYVLCGSEYWIIKCPITLCRQNSSAANYFSIGFIGKGPVIFITYKSKVENLWQRY